MLKEISVEKIKGIAIGNANYDEGRTGCTAILCEDGAVAGVDVRGGGPATRETDSLNPKNMIQEIHCVMLSGGSAYGLDSCSGAMAYLEEKGKGFPVGVATVPIVCGACLFDLQMGDAKVRPDKALGYEACKNSETQAIQEGNNCAGYGATIGKYLGVESMMKSGLGIYAVQLGEVQVTCVVAVNCLGDVFDYETGKQIGGMINKDGTLGSTAKAMYEEISKSRNVFTGNTTIGCVITNGKLTKDQANKLASIAHNGYAKTIYPVHTSVDGDTIFVLATGEVEVKNVDALGALVVEVMGKAINRAVEKAESIDGIKCSKDVL